MISRQLAAFPQGSPACWCSRLNGCHRGSRGQQLEDEDWQQPHSWQLAWCLPPPSHPSSWLCVVGTGAWFWLLLR